MSVNSSDIRFMLYVAGMIHLNMIQCMSVRFIIDWSTSITRESHSTWQNSNMYENNLTEKWIHRYLRMSEWVSHWSKDPSTKCGCVIVHPEKKTVVSLGYNGFPSHVEDTPEYLNDREVKYVNMIHAEENAIFNSLRRDHTGMHLFVYPFTPCHNCAELIVEVGISHVYTVVFDRDNDRFMRWRDSFEMTMCLFDKNNVGYSEHALQVSTNAL